MDDDETTTYDETSTELDDAGESWLAEQARLVLLEDGS
jgi:hypothetical protein